ncbi:hypothetical protein ACFQVA_22100 [Actinomadura keratinilytica]
MWMLRAQIRQAFQRLTRLETPAGTLEFEAAARAVRDEADDLRAPRRSPAGRCPVPSGPTPTAGGPRTRTRNRRRTRTPSSRSGGRAVRVSAWRRLGCSFGRRRRPYRSGPPPPARRDPFQDALELAADSPVRAVALAWERLVVCAVEVLDARGHPLGPQPYAHSSEQIRGWLAGLGLPVEAQGVHRRLQALWNQAFQHPEAVTPAAAATTSVAAGPSRPSYANSPDPAAPLPATQVVHPGGADAAAVRDHAAGEAFV